MLVIILTINLVAVPVPNLTLIPAVIGLKRRYNVGLALPYLKNTAKCPLT